MFSRLPPIACALIAGIAAAPPGRAYTISQQMDQPAVGNVEAAYIRVIACNGPGENGRQFYVYEYNRAASQANFRAIEPPSWGLAIGGHDYDTFQQAAQAACS
jgi:hypothetical protein